MITRHGRQRDARQELNSCHTVLQAGRRDGVTGGGDDEPVDLDEKGGLLRAGDLLEQGDGGMTGWMMASKAGQGRLSLVAGEIGIDAKLKEEVDDRGGRCIVLFETGRVERCVATH